MTILDAMRDRALFGPWFSAESWRAWLVFLSVLFGLPLEGDDRDTYARHTGRAEAPTTAAKEAWVIVGRRGGKSRIAALVAVFLACFRDYSAVLASGEVGTLAVIAADRKQARTILRYINGFLDGVPMLARMVESRTSESITLTNRIVLEVHTANWRTLRGYTLVGAICDEIAFWRSEDSANPDTEILAGLRPGMGTIPGALLLCISSPYARRGALFSAWAKHYGQAGDPVLVWQGDTASMNPTMDPQVIAEAYASDDAAAAAEYGATFRRDIESFVLREHVEAVTVPGRTMLPPLRGVTYRAHIDAAGGSGADSMTAAVAHSDTDGRAVLDLVLERKPPFSPPQVAEEFSAVLKQYGCTMAEADRYAGDWVTSAFAKHSVAIRPCAKSRSEIYGEFLPLVSAGRCELLDSKRLLGQLLNLERRTGRTRDVIDHPVGHHDDVILVAAGALVQVVRRSTGGQVQPGRVTFGGSGRDGSPTNLSNSSPTRRPTPTLYRASASCGRHAFFVEGASREALAVRLASWRCPIVGCGRPAVRATNTGTINPTGEIPSPTKGAISR